MQYKLGRKPRAFNPRIPHMSALLGRKRLAPPPEVLGFAGMCHCVLISGAMHAIQAFFSSSLVGFLLRLFSGIAAIGFGILGMEKKTHTPEGKLTRTGWVTLTGIIMAGLFAIGSSIYDYAAGQKKQRIEDQSRQQLLQSIRRGLYPLRGVTIDVSIRLGDNSPSIANYKRHLRKHFAQRPPCNAARADFNCDNTPETYTIPRTSRLFPVAGSPAYNAFMAPDITVVLFRPSIDTTQKYDVAGVFWVYWWDAAGAQVSLRYNYAADYIYLWITGLHMAEKELGESQPSSVYSLVDFIPGMIAALPVGFTDASCKLDDRCAPAFITSMSFRFAYAKTISVSSETAINCGSDKQQILAVPLTGDIDTYNSFPLITGKPRTALEISDACLFFKDHK